LLPLHARSDFGHLLLFTLFLSCEGFYLFDTLCGAALGLLTLFDNMVISKVILFVPSHPLPYSPPGVFASFPVSLSEKRAVLTQTSIFLFERAPPEM